MSRNSFIHDFTEKTGLSQEDLATLLNISRSTVAMACKGERSIPTKALLRFVQIEQAMDAMEDPEGPTFRGMDKWKEKIEFEIKELRYRVKVLERFIAKYQTRQQQWKQREKMLRVIEQQHQTTLPDPVEEKWLELKKYMQYLYPTKDDKKYVRAIIQIPLLLQEADALETTIGKWGN